MAADSAGSAPYTVIDPDDRQAHPYYVSPLHVQPRGRVGTHLVPHSRAATSSRPRACLRPHLAAQRISSGLRKSVLTICRRALVAWCLVPAVIALDKQLCMLCRGSSPQSARATCRRLRRRFAAGPSVR